jgi:hypothetical protein
LGETRSLVQLKDINEPSITGNGDDGRRLSRDGGTRRKKPNQISFFFYRLFSYREHEVENDFLLSW